MNANGSDVRHGRQTAWLQEESLCTALEPAATDVLAEGINFDERLPLFPAQPDDVSLLLEKYRSKASVLPQLEAQFADVCGRWLTALFGLPQHTTLALTSDASSALTRAMVAARSALCKRQGLDAATLLRDGAPRLRVVVGGKPSPQFLRMLTGLGVREEDVTVAPTDERGRLRVDILPPLDASTILIARAIGADSLAIDPLHELCEIAHRAGAWVHVDGAFGLWTATSARYRHLVSGIGNADSWSADAGSLPNVPHGCSIALCREPDVFSDAMPGTAASNSHAVPLWTALRQLGAEGIAQLVDGRCDVAVRLSGKLRECGYDIENTAGSSRFVVKRNRFAEQLLPRGICRCYIAEWNGESALWVDVQSANASSKELENRSCFCKSRKSHD